MSEHWSLVWGIYVLSLADGCRLMAALNFGLTISNVNDILLVKQVFTHKKKIVRMQQSNVTSICFNWKRFVS